MEIVKMRVIAAVLVAAIIGVLPGATASATGSNPPGVDYIYEATNDYRTSNGVSTLAFDASLHAVAQAWAEKMAADYAGGMTIEQAFRHNPNMTLQIPPGWQGAGENIALNGGYSEPYAKLMDQWKTSPGHNANMLNSTWTAIGVGVYTDTSGITWGVQVFAAYPAVTLLLSGPSTLVTGGDGAFHGGGGSEGVGVVGFAVSGAWWGVDHVGDDGSGEGWGGVVCFSSQGDGVVSGDVWWREVESD